ncbi:hypothetical protein ACOMHN_058433 [Nucella lapillus]
MREAEAQLQALIQSAGSYMCTTGTTPHIFLPVSSTSASASHFLSPPSTSGLFGGSYAMSQANARQILGGEENVSYRTSLGPRLVMCGSGGGGGGGGGGVPVGPRQEDTEKARMRQYKAALRRERNKAAARKSNLNRKLFRDQLEKKSLELWEENLQLQQDIRQLNNQLRHYGHVRRAIRHVCHSSGLPPPPPYPAVTMCRR